MSQLKLEGIRLQGSNEQIQLNFGAFAKGYAIEKSIKTLQQFGITDAVINAGGDLKVIGQHGTRPWHVGIRDPRNADGVIASLDVANGESVFTSGDYERNFTYNGQVYHHILDPRTGYPAMQTQSVTVIHTDAGIADAAATALFVAGPDNWHRIAKNMGIKFVMLIGNDGTLYMNPAMQQRIVLQHPDTALVKLSPPL
jgi:thiamine biosynthesis lipoprotein